MPAPLVEVGEVKGVKAIAAHSTSLLSPPFSCPEKMHGSSVLLCHGNGLIQQHDAVSGAILASERTAGPSSTSSTSSSSSELTPVITVGEDGALLVVSLGEKSSSFSVTEMGTGQALTLRMALKSKVSSSPITCMTGSCTPGSGLVFLARQGASLVQTVKVWPRGETGSTSQTIHRGSSSSSGGAEPLALACCPLSPIFATALSDGSIRVWDYSSLAGSGRAKVEDQHGGGMSALSGNITLDNLEGGSMSMSPPMTPPPSEGKAPQASRDGADKLGIPVRPLIPGALRLVAAFVHPLRRPEAGLSPQQPQPLAYELLAFHPTLERLAAATKEGGISLWNFEGESLLESNSAGGSRLIGSGAIGWEQAGDGDSEEGSLALQGGNSGPSPVKEIVPYATTSLAWLTPNCKHKVQGMLGIPNATFMASTRLVALHLHPSEPLVVVITSEAKRGSHADVYAASDRVCNLHLLSSLQPSLPRVETIALPFPPAFTCLNAATGRLFLSEYLNPPAPGSAAVPAEVPAVRTMAWLPSPLGNAPLALPPQHFLPRSKPTSSEAPAASPDGINVSEAEVYFVRSIPVLVKAGDTGIADIMAVTSVLFSQRLERDKSLKARGRPRRVCALPGHTDDDQVARSAGKSKGWAKQNFVSGQLKPFRLVSAAGVAHVVLYKVVPIDNVQPAPTARDDAVLFPATTVCSLISPAGQASPLVAASDGCILQVPGEADGPSGAAVLLVEGGGYHVSAYKLKLANGALEPSLISTQETLLPVARCFATSGPQLRSAQVLFLVSRGLPRAAKPTWALLYSAGGVQCPSVPSAGACPFPNFSLEPGEVLVDAVFQPLCTAAEASLWGYRGQQMLAVVTDRRVALLSAPTLKLINTVSMAAPGGLGSLCSSVAWVGGALLVAKEGGQISYITGSATSLAPVCGANRSFGHPGMHLIAALPDRICFLARDAGISHLITRPFLPLEPLVCGLLGANVPAPLDVKLVRKLKRSGLDVPDPPQIGPQCLTALSEIVQCYSPNATGQQPNEGAGSSAGATDRAVSCLLSHHLYHLAATVGGCTMEDTPSERRGTSQFFRRRPWVGGSTRCFAAKEAGYYYSAALEALGDDPALFEYALDSEVMAAVSLPARSSKLAGMASLLAGCCIKSGRLDQARRLLDIAGDDFGLVQLLRAAACSGDASLEEAALDHLRQLGKSSVDAAVQAEAAAAAAPGSHGPIVQPASSLYFRRSTLMSGLDPLPEAAARPTTKSQLQQKATGRSPGVPPTTGLKSLALHAPEEWVGRARPECTAALSFADPAAASTNSNWVTIGGQGGRSAEGSVCGYWRFGTAVAESEMAAAAGAQSFAVHDLSTYGSAGRAHGALRLEASTSPADPGEAGKVEEAYDVCFPADPPAPKADTTDDATAGGCSYSRGVCFPVKRGCALDIGLFHDEPARCKMTLELWVKREGSRLEDDHEGGRYHILATRASRLQEKRQHIWTLSVEHDGKLSFLPGPRGRVELGDRSLRGGVASPAGVIQPSRWVHVAMSLDSTREGSGADVKLFVDCEEVGMGTCSLAGMREESLQDSVMVLGADLCRWRMAEVRLWAELRDATLLQDLKEVNLALAETKKGAGRLVIREAGSVTRKPKQASGGLALAPPPPSGRQDRRARKGTGSPGLPTPPGASAPRDPRKKLLASPGGSPAPRRRDHRKSLAAATEARASASSAASVSSTASGKYGGSSVSSGGSVSSQPGGISAVPHVLGRHQHPPVTLGGGGRSQKKAEEEANVGAKGVGAVASRLLFSVSQVPPAEMASSSKLHSLLASTPHHICLPHGKSLLVWDINYAGDSPGSAAPASYPIPSISAMLSPNMEQKVIALYAVGIIQVFKIGSGGKKLRSLPMAAPLEYWQWLDGHTIGLVTSSALFSWDITGEEKPRKVTDRRHTVSLRCESIQSAAVSGSTWMMLRAGNIFDVHCIPALQGESTSPSQPLRLDACGAALVNARWVAAVMLDGSLQVLSLSPQGMELVGSCSLEGPVKITKQPFTILELERRAGQGRDECELALVGQDGCVAFVTCCASPSAASLTCTVRAVGSVSKKVLSAAAAASACGGNGPGRGSVVIVTKDGSVLACSC